MSNGSKPRQVPPPSGTPAKPGAPAAAPSASPYTRFIPREEVHAFEAWNPGALSGRGDAPKPPPPPAPSLEEQRAALQAARQSGYQDGYRDGLVALEAFKQSYAKQVNTQIGALLASFDARLGELEGRMAEALASAACQLARQVVRQELGTQPELVAAVAREALGQLLLSARHITLQVHPDDMPLVMEGAGEEIQHRGARLVASSAVARGGCVLESDLGSIDATIETRWRRAAGALGDEDEFGSGPTEPGPLTLREGD